MKINARLLSLIFLFSVSCHQVIAQQNKMDSIGLLLGKWKHSKSQDSASFNSALTMISALKMEAETVNKLENIAAKLKLGKDRAYVDMAIYLSYSSRNPDKAIEYGKQLVEELKKSDTPEGGKIVNTLLNSLRFPFRNSTKIEEGFDYYNDQLNHYLLAKDSMIISTCYYVLGGFYRTIGLGDQSIYYMKKSISYIDTADKSDLSKMSVWVNNTSVLGGLYLENKNYKEALKYSYPIYYKYFKDSGSYSGIVSSYVSSVIANAKMHLRQYDSTEYFLNYGLQLADKYKNFDDLAVLYQTYAHFQILSGKLDSAEIHLNYSQEIITANNLPPNSGAGVLCPDYYRALLRIKQKKYAEAVELLIKDIGLMLNLRQEKLRDYKLMAEVYELMGNEKEAKESYKKYIALRDQILEDENKFRTISFEAEQVLNETNAAMVKLQSEQKYASVLQKYFIGLGVLLVLLVVVVFGRYRSKHKANVVLGKTLEDLKTTQAQLIQSEKMASLGELTAGIAHEIQNPLNFVNNFSEVNTELVDELQLELEKGNTDEVKAIAKDIRENQQKITHHGKRADAIVKSMLQHSRNNRGVKEPTDINALADEYLRLAYHGLRAKDKNFNAGMKTEFDDSIGKINILSQDVGRVILNLITNAFYAVNEKKKQNLNGYEPMVTVSTKKINGSMRLTVSDNGDGMSQEVVEKIFQPFFTTKPTGEGTGLGLSMSYDIITKGHDGELSVETEPGKGTSFTITLK